MSALTDLFTELELLVAKMESIAFGDENKIVTHNGVDRPSLAKEIADKFTSLQSLVGGKIPFSTKVTLAVSGAPSIDANGYYPLAYVWNDLDGDKNGLYGWDGAAWVKNDYDSVNFADGANVLLDPLNQMVVSVPDLNGFSHFMSGGHVAVDSIFSGDGNALESTVDGARVVRDFNIPSDFIGKSLAVRTYADFDVGGGYTLVYRDVNRNIISSNSLFPAPGAGGNYYSLRRDVPENATTLSVMLEPSSGKVRVHFYGASFQGVPRPFEIVNASVLVDAAKTVTDASIKSAIDAAKVVTDASIKDVVDAAVGHNVFVDPLNQVVPAIQNLNGFSHFLSGDHVVVPNIFSPDGGALESISDGARVARDFNIPNDYVGKSLAVRTYADFDVGGGYTLVYRDVNRNIISSNSLFPAPGAGGNYYSMRLDVPDNAAVLSVILEPSSGKVRVHFYGASFQGVPQPSEVINSVGVFNALIKTSNILFDSFNRFANVNTRIEGFKSVNSGRIFDSQNGVTNHPVLTNAVDDSFNKFERLYSMERAGLIEADSFNLRVSVWSASGCTVKIHFRTSTGSVRALVSTKVASAGFVELSFDNITVYSDSHSLSVIVENPSGAAELISSFASKTGVPSDNEILPTPSEMAEVVGIVTNSGVAGGKLVVDSVQLNPANLYVNSAFEVSPGLWEFIAQGQVYRVLTSAPDVVVCVPVSGKVTLVLVSGQSLSVGASSGNTIDPAASITGFTGRMLMPGGSKSQGVEDWPLTTNSISALGYLKNDSNLSCSPGTSAIYQALSLGIDASFLLLSHGISGKQIEYLRDGNSTANAAIQLQRAKSLIESYGLQVDSRVPMIWNQGEADGTDTNYADDLISLVEMYKSMIATHLGSGYSLTFLVDQVSRSYSKAPALAQYQVCDSRDDCIMALTKAHMQLKYNMNAETANSDGTHMSKRGYFLMGAYWGKAIYGLLSRGDFNSLDKRAITIDGNKIHVDFMVADSRLIFDSAIDVANLGFSYDDNLSNTILSAEIVSRDRVTLTMSTDISSASLRVLGLGRNVEVTGNYTGSPLRTNSQLFVPELSENLHDWALCWEVGI